LLNRNYYYYCKFPKNKKYILSGLNWLIQVILIGQVYFWALLFFYRLWRHVATKT